MQSEEASCIIQVRTLSITRGPFEKFVDWRHCAAVIPSYSGGVT
jgi:hypothetical protein